MKDYREFLSSKNKKETVFAPSTSRFLRDLLLYYFESATKIMDFGGGDGARMEMLIDPKDNKEIYFIEPIELELTRAKQKLASYNSKFYYLRSLDHLDGGEFDLVHVVGVFELFDEKTLVDYLKRLVNFLSGNGYFIIYNTHYSPLSFDSIRHRLVGLLKYRKIRYFFSPYDYHIEKIFYKNKLGHQQFLDLLNSLGLTICNVFPYFYIRNYPCLKVIQPLRFLELKIIYKLPWLNKFYAKISSGNYIICQKVRI